MLAYSRKSRILYLCCIHFVLELIHCTNSMGIFLTKYCISNCLEQSVFFYSFRANQMSCLPVCAQYQGNKFLPVYIGLQVYFAPLLREIMFRRNRSNVRFIMNLFLLRVFFFPGPVLFAGSLCIIFLNSIRPAFSFTWFHSDLYLPMCTS